MQEHLIIQRLIKMGVAEVKFRLNNHSLPPSWESVAIKWLAQDAEWERLANEALISEQTRVALSAKRAAWIAAITAIIMVIIDITVRVISYLPYIYPVR